MSPRLFALAAWLLLGLPIWTPSGGAQAQGLTPTPEVSQEQAQIARQVMETAVGAPARVTLLDQATLRLEGSLQFIERGLASRYLRSYGQAEPDGLVGLLIHGGRDVPWYATIRLVRDGFVDISTVRRWTADDILASLRDDLKRENEERVARNQPPRVIAGWRIPPRYDEETQSLVWSVVSYVPGVSAHNESDTTAHVIVFGREGYFETTIVTVGSAIRDYPHDIGLITANLRFVEGKTYRDFDPAADRAMHRGLEAVLRVSNLRPLGFLENDLTEEHLMVFLVGGALVIGAGIMAGGMWLAQWRRNHRRR